MRTLLALSLTLLAVPALAQAPVTLRNATDQEVFAAYLAPPGSTEWRDDLLGAATVAAGQSHEIRRPSQDCVYDLRLVLKPGPEVIRRSFNVCTTPEVVLTQAEVAAAQARSWRLENATTSTLLNLYITRPGATADRGEDRFGPVSLDPGASFYVPRPAAGQCSADVVVRTAGGGEAIRPGLDLCVVDTVVIDQIDGEAPDRTPASVSVINRTGRPIAALHISAVAEANWGPNRLSQPLADGERYEFEAPNDNRCLYDARIVFPDGGREDRMLVNFCQIGELLFEPLARGGDKRP
jgi:post-segregation antitoxin (ccd killing protein)